MPMPLVGKHEVFVVVEEALGVESLRAGEHNETGVGNMELGGRWRSRIYR